MLEVIFITCSTIYGEFIKPGVLQVINPLLKMHLVVTNRSFWISLLSQETVHCALCSCITWWRKCNIWCELCDQYSYRHHYNIPPNNVESKQCFLDSSIQCNRNLWVYEEGFKEKSWSYKLLNPSSAEFSTVIICMFYAMFLEKKLLMKALGIMYQPDIQIFHSLAFFVAFSSSSLLWHFACLTMNLCFQFQPTWSITCAFLDLFLLFLLE